MMSGSVSINYGHELAQDLGLIDSGRSAGYPPWALTHASRT
jgi:hypothetical protein